MSKVWCGETDNLFTLLHTILYTETHKLSPPSLKSHLLNKLIFLLYNMDEKQ